MFDKLTHWFTSYLTNPANSALSNSLHTIRNTFHEMCGWPLGQLNIKSHKIHIARNRISTWNCNQTGLQCTRLCRHSRVRALHGYSLLGASAGNYVWRLPLPLQSLLDGGNIRGQIGQLVEHITFADDCVNQVAVSWRWEKEVHYIKGDVQVPSTTSISSIKKERLVDSSSDSC